MKRIIIYIAIIALLLPSCSRPLTAEEVYCTPHQEGEATLFRLANENGMEIKVTNFGASLTDVIVPNREGVREHVVLGFDSLHLYLGKQPKLGATVGRYANRIRGAELTIDGQFYRLDTNNKENCIHGGFAGYHQQLFGVDTLYADADTAAIVFSRLSPDGEGGFPGNLLLKVAYKLTAHNEVIIDYQATSDQPTVVNLTNHSYFNLAGGKRTVADHCYRIAADSITETDESGLPTGRLLAVEGRVLKAFTTEPGMQFYLPQKAMNGRTGHDGQRYGPFFGFCLEMQHFPDAPHHPHFPSTRLNPGETYRQRTIYRFETLQD